MNMIKITIESGQEVIAVLERECAKRKIKNGAIVPIIGAVDECCLHNMSRMDSHHSVINEYKQHLEMSGSGEIRDGEPHIHCVMSRENEETIAGHLHWAKVENWFVEVYIVPLEK